MTDTGRTAGVGRWTKLVLVISLALNFMVVGVIIGLALGARPGAHRDVRAFRHAGLNPFAEALSPSDRRALRRALVGRRPALRAARNRVRKSTVRLLAALRAEPFEPKSLAPLLLELRSNAGAVSRIGQTLLIERLASMTARERKGYADRLEREFGRGARRGARRRVPNG